MTKPKEMACCFDNKHSPAANLVLSVFMSRLWPSLKCKVSSADVKNDTVFVARYFFLWIGGSVVFAIHAYLHWSMLPELALLFYSFDLFEIRCVSSTQGLHLNKGTGS